MPEAPRPQGSAASLRSLAVAAPGACLSCQLCRIFWKKRPLLACPGIQSTLPSSKIGMSLHSAEALMERGNMSRRGFMATMAGGLTAAGLPVWFANELIVDAQEKDKT